MPFVTFAADFDFDQQAGVTIAYKAGWSGNVTTACVTAAGDRCVTASPPEMHRNGINETIKGGRVKRNRRV